MKRKYIKRKAYSHRGFIILMIISYNFVIFWTISNFRFPISDL